LHKFRKTFASFFAQKHGIELARQLLGHSDIATTQLYLSADSADVQKMRDSIDDMTAAFTR
jgi:site-specific recombinase XerD